MYNSKERISEIDTIRVICCFAIILLHTVSGWIDDPVGGKIFCDSSRFRFFFDTAFLPLFVRYAVPIFFMISGVFFLSDQIKDYNYLFAKIKKLLTIILCFGGVMCLIELIFKTKSFYFSFLLDALMDILEGNTWSHMWFLYALVGCYFISPFLRIWICYSTEHQFDVLIIFLILIFSVIPSINNYFNLHIVSFGLTSTSGAFMYFVLGRWLYIRLKSTIKMKYLISIGLFAGGNVVRIWAKPQS